MEGHALRKRKKLPPTAPHALVLVLVLAQMQAALSWLPRVYTRAGARKEGEQEATGVSLRASSK
jgi:hypothetical protein